MSASRPPASRAPPVWTRSPGTAVCVRRAAPARSARMVSDKLV